MILTLDSKAAAELRRWMDNPDGWKWVLSIVDADLNRHEVHVEHPGVDRAHQCGADVGPGIWCVRRKGHTGLHARSDDPSIPQNKGNGQV